MRKYRKRSIQNIEMTIKYHKWKNFSEEAFQDDLEEAPWSVLDMFNRTFLYVADDHVPLLTKRVKRQGQSTWMTPVKLNDQSGRYRAL